MSVNETQDAPAAADAAVGAGVVVGVDGSPSGARALEWAALEAAAHGLPLRIVVAGPAEPAPGAESGRGVLDDALARCAVVAPEVAVTGAVRSGEPAAVLLRAAADAALLVVGRTGRGNRIGPHVGSVPDAVVRYASCSVAVVAADPLAGVVRWNGDVLVGIDGSDHDAAVLSAAFSAAAVRGGRLTIAHGPGEPDRRRGSTVSGREVLDAAIGVWTVRHPGVDVIGRVVAGGPIHGLVALSPIAALLVVGAVGGEGLPSELLGSVPRALAGRVACPVLVVRDRG